MTDSNKEQIEYEKLLRRRLSILQKQMKEGKVHIAEGLKVADSLEAVRMGADGQVDLSTVDGLVRSMALAVTELHDRDELKTIATLSDIQNAYFNFIDNNFSPYYKVMKQKGLSPHEAGLSAMQSEDSIKSLNDNLDDFLGYINKFWAELGDIAHIHVEDMHNNVKGVFGGDLFPSSTENIASKCGIYIDTIILPDPFIRSKLLFEKSDPADKAYYLIKHAMNVLQYKDLACANIAIPIIVVLPDRSAFEQDEREFYLMLGKEDSLKHSGKLFGRNFESFDEILEFAQKLDTIERAMAEVSDDSRVLFDTEWSGSKALQLKKAVDGSYAKLLGSNHPGNMLAFMSLGRMSVSNELLVNARRIQGTPIMDSPSSWQYLVWKMEYDSDAAQLATNTNDLHVTRALHDLGSSELEWLGNIPPQALIELRKQDALGEIRHILGSGIDKLTTHNPTNFHRTRDQVFENINEAFNNHKENVNTLRSKQWSFAGTDIGSWLVTGTLGITAAATGTPFWAFAALASDQVLNAPKLRDIPTSIKNLIEENNKVQKSPVGMLFNIKSKSK